MAGRILNCGVQGDNAMSNTLAVALAAAVVAVAGANIPAQAGTQCKAAVSGLGFSQNASITSWRNQVRSRYGSKWTDFGRARGVRYSQSGFVPAQFYTVTAEPCRKT